MSRMTVDEYLRRPDATGGRELAYGTLRVPSRPGADHDTTVVRLAALIDQHARRHGLGRVSTPPVDLVLDRDRALIVQPDLAFLAAGSPVRVEGAQIWGPPDLVVEVLSLGSERHDRVTKVAWYRKYGVRECWLVDPAARTVDVLDLAGGRAEGAHRCYQGAVPVCSSVLGPLTVRTARLFVSGPPDA